MTDKRFLVVEDSVDQASRYQKLLITLGQVSLAHKEADAQKCLEQSNFDILITDVHLSGEEDRLDFGGLKLVEHTRQNFPHMQILVMSADPELSTYERAMKLGADFFLKKPIISKDEFAIAIHAAEKSHMQKKLASLERKRQSSFETRFADGVILPDQIRQTTLNIAKSGGLPVVIYGETGTGKEEVAKIIHKRREELDGPIPFVPVNCANLNGETAVSRIFGHRKGAFTGATETTSGFVGDADGGILFLDEIHRLDEECQARLLRILNDGSYERLGESKTLYSKFQVIVASNKDLDELVENGSFLMDLRSRLIGIDIHLDPLRKRKSDLRDLILLFMKKDGWQIASDDLDELVEKCQEYYWQGNIRQLYNVMRSHATICQLNEIPITAVNFPEFKSMFPPQKATDEAEDNIGRTLQNRQPNGEFLTEEIRSQVLAPLSRDCTFKDAVENYEKLILEAAIFRHKNLAQISSALNIGRSSLDVRRKKFSLEI